MTKENASYYLSIVEALAEGKTVQFLDTDNNWIDRVSHNFGNAPERYRIKPEPAMVPLGPEDVPPGSLLRNKDVPWAVVLAVTETGFVMPSKFRGEIYHPYREAMELGSEIKRPGEDWKPCCKPANE
jgi:hypothetical protein